MLKYYVKTAEALKRLRADEDGVVSFEYIIVACCIIAAVAAVFSGTGPGTIAGTLKAGLTNITTAFSTALP
jgi:pilus assembly protein Flp/PilA